MSARRFTSGWHAVIMTGLLGATIGASCGARDEAYCASDFCKVGFPYVCKNWAGVEIVECHVSSFEADFWCKQNGGGTASEAPCPALGEGAGTSESETGGDAADTDEPAQPWDPGSHIEFDETRGAYLVDAVFIAGVQADPSLLDQDSAKLIETADGGYFELAGVAPGDLADVMGLRSGDVMLDVNGYDLGTVDGHIAAYSELKDAHEFVLSFERGGRLVRARYIIVEERLH